MTATRTIPAKGQRTRREWAFLLLAALAFMAACIGAGWLANNAQRSGRAVTVSSTFTGRVTVVSGDGRSGCVKPDSGAARVCSVFALVRPTALSVGQLVHVAHEQISTGGGNGYDVLLVYPDNPEGP